MFDFLKSCVTFVHSYFIFSYIEKNCVDNMFGFVCARTTCNLEKLLTTLNFCFVILKKILGNFSLACFHQPCLHNVLCEK